MMKKAIVALVAIIVWMLVLTAGWVSLLMNPVVGPQGIQGVQGPQGIQGVQGMPGTPGLKGDTGSRGSTGGTGATGSQGSPGSQGPSGTDGVDAPVNTPPILNCSMNGLFYDGGYYEYYTFDLSVNCNDSDGDTVQTTIYYKSCSEMDWDELWMTTDLCCNLSKTVKFACGPESVTLWWMVLGWDGSDLTSWYGNYTVTIPEL